MRRKTFKISGDLTKFAVPLDRLLTDIDNNALWSAQGEYTGTGVSGQFIQTPFYPLIIVISPKVNTATASATISGNMIFALTKNAGVAWVPGTGFRKDCVLSAEKTGFTIGNNSNVNTPGQTYLYFMIG